MGYSPKSVDYNFGSIISNTSNSANINTYNIPTSSTNKNEVESIDVLDEIKGFFSEVKQKVFHKEEYEIEQLECSDDLKNILKSLRKCIEEEDKEIEELEATLKEKNKIMMEYTTSNNNGAGNKNDILSQAQANATQSATMNSTPNYNSSSTINSSVTWTTNKTYTPEEINAINEEIKQLNEELTNKREQRNNDYFVYSQAFHSAQLLPYEEMSETDEFKNYINSLKDVKYDKLIEVSEACNFKDFQYLTDDQANIICYLYNTKGEEAVKEYLEIIEDEINNMKGMEEAYDFLSKLTLDIEDQFIKDASSKYGIDYENLSEFMKGLSFTDLMDKEAFAASISEKYPNLTNEEISNLIQDMADNAKLKDGEEKVLNYLGVSAKGFRDGIQTFCEGIVNAVKDNKTLSQNEYASMYIISALSSTNSWLDDAYQISSSIGNMAIPSLVSLATTYVGIPIAGEIAGAQTFAEAAATINTITNVAQLTSKVLFFTSTFGNAKHDKLVQGSDKETAIVSALISATSEVGLESVLGSIPGLGSLEGKWYGFLSEGIEEGLQEYISAGADAILYGTPIDFTELNANARKSAVYGMVTSIAMNSVSKPTTSALGSIPLTIVEDGVTYKIPQKDVIKILSEQNGEIDYTKIEKYKVNNDDNSSNINSKIEVLEPISNKNKNNILNDNIKNQSVVNSNRLNYNFKKNSVDKYGGNQEAIYDLSKKVFKTNSEKQDLQKYQSIIKNNNSNYTQNDIQLEIENFKKNGCSYVAKANMILEQIGYNHETLKSIFGDFIFDSKGNIDVNALALDIYSFLSNQSEVTISTYEKITADSVIEAAKKILNKDFSSENEAILALFNEGWRIDGNEYTNAAHPKVETVYGDLDSIAELITGNRYEGITLNELKLLAKENNKDIARVGNTAAGSKFSWGNDTWFEKYLSEKGYNLNFDTKAISDVTIEKLSDYIQKGYSIEVSYPAGGDRVAMTDGTALGYTYFGTENFSTGHAMTLKGITSDGDIVVSSWGKLFKVPKEYINKLEYYAFKGNSVSTEGKLVLDDIVIDSDSSRTNSSIETLTNDNNQKYNISDKIINDINQSLENNTFDIYLNELITKGENVIPQSYHGDVNKYKQEVVRTLIESGKINEINPNQLYTMTTDPIFFESLIGTQKLDNLFLKNWDNEDLRNLLTKNMTKLSPEILNDFLSRENITNLINDMNSDSFIAFVNSFESNVNWLVSGTIIEKICNLSKNDFYKLISKINLSYYISRYLEGNNNTEAYKKLLNTIDSTFYTVDDMSNFDHTTNIYNILPNYNCEDASVNDIYNIIYNKVYETNRKAIQSIIDLSNIEVIDYGSQLAISADKNSYYDLTYLINGETKTMTLKSSNNQVSLYSLTDDNEIMSSALNNKVKILSCDKNKIKSDFCLDESSGLGLGLNKITYELDGTKFEKFVNNTYNTVDLNNIIDTTNVNEGKILDIQAIGDYEYVVDDPNGLYLVNYTYKGKNKSVYMSPTKGILGKGNYLDMNNYIINNNLGILDNFNVTAINEDMLSKNIYSLPSNKITKYLFNSNYYGGNQSDVASLIVNKYTGVKMSDIDTNKANIIDNIINSYYPDATDMQKINLTEAYAKSGCCYMAVANAFMNYMGTVDNAANLFYNKFDYSLMSVDTNGNASCNVEALAFNIFLDYYSKNSSNIDEAIENGSGVAMVEFDSKIVDFFKSKNIHVEANKINTMSYNEKMNNLANILNNTNGYNILMAKNFDLSLVGSDNIRGVNYDSASNSSANRVGSHAMLITSVEDENNLIVSSWKNKYTFSYDSVNKYKENDSSSHADVMGINFSIY